jgi:hypothetical protein
MYHGNRMRTNSIENIQEVEIMDLRYPPAFSTARGTAINSTPDCFKSH